MRSLVVLIVCSVCGFVASASADITIPLAPANGTTERSLIIKPQGRVVVVDTSIEILDDVAFVTATARMTRTSDRTLDAVASSLANNPSLTKIEVQGFGGDLASKRSSQTALGELRARLVVAALVKRGVSPQRLQAVGYAKAARAKDAKISFLIVTRAS